VTNGADALAECITPNKTKWANGFAPNADQMIFLMERGQYKMKIEIATITPYMAEKLLKSNIQNRRVKLHQIDSLKRDILSGNWKENGDAIRIHQNGTLMDGQHRLMACVSANVPIKTIVVSELDDDVKSTIDCGVKRKYNDHLSLRGFSYSTQIASTMTLLIGLAHNSASVIASTYSERDKFLENHPRVIDSAAKCHKAFKGVHSILSAVHYIGCYLGKETKANEFVNVWKTGDKTYYGDPAHFAREYLIKNIGNAKNINIAFKNRLIVHSWNKFSNNDPLFRSVTPDTYCIPNWNKNCL